MATTYKIDFTDNNQNKSFQLAPYTSNGPIRPTSGSLPDTSSSAATSLLLYGKGSSDYGERIHENQIHMLEHFAGTSAPEYPIRGQIWCNTSTSPSTLHKYSDDKHPILNNLPPYTGMNEFITLAGDLTTQFLPSSRFRVVSSNGYHYDYLVGSSVFLDTNGNTVISIDPSPIVGLDLVGWFVGDWESIMQLDIGLEDDLNANNNTIFGLRSPVNPDEVATKQYVDFTAANTVTLKDLTDTNIYAPVEYDVLSYSAGLWENKSLIDAKILSTLGGNVYGKITMNGNAIDGLVLPVELDEATPKYYVDTEITNAIGSATLAGLTDTEITLPTETQLLSLFNGIWTNRDISDSGVLPLVGGTMLGGIDMGQYKLNGIADPVQPEDVSNRRYVDDAITAAMVGSVNVLEDVADVVYVGGQQQNDTLQWNGSAWRNVSRGDFVFNMGVVDIAGGTLTGFLTLDADPILDLHAATKIYVDDQILDIVNGYTDSVVHDGFFDSATQVLTLMRTNGLSNVEISGFATNQLQSFQVLHEIVDPITYPTNQRNLYSEDAFGYSVIYPNISVKDHIKSTNQHLGELASIRQRQTLILDGTANVRFGPNSSYGDISLEYVSGTNSLDVYLNGTKQLISDTGWIEISANIDGDPSTPVPIWPGTLAGLDPNETYYFMVDINVGAANGTNIPTITVPIVGASVNTIGTMIAQIHAYVDTATNYTTFNGNIPLSGTQPAFGVTMERGSIQFHSGYPGTESSIKITDGDGIGGLGLFAALNGTTSSGNYVIDNVDTPDSRRNDGLSRVPSGILNPPAPVTRDINEFGRIGRASEFFYFLTAPTVGDVMEVTVNPVMIYNHEVQTLP